jgi:uncharacterized membrane protein YtjA (UPF0391 family)
MKAQAKGPMWQPLPMVVFGPCFANQPPRAPAPGGFLTPSHIHRCALCATLLQRTDSRDDGACAARRIRWLPFKAGGVAPAGHPLKEHTMLKYAIVFALISLVAGALGFTGVAAGAAGIAKILFVLFLIIAVVFLVLAVLGVGAARKALK